MTPLKLTGIKRIRPSRMDTQAYKREMDRLQNERTERLRQEIELRKKIS